MSDVLRAVGWMLLGLVVVAVLFGAVTLLIYLRWPHGRDR